MKRKYSKSQQLLQYKACGVNGEKLRSLTEAQTCVDSVAQQGDEMGMTRKRGNVKREPWDSEIVVTAT